MKTDDSDEKSIDSNLYKQETNKNRNRNQTKKNKKMNGDYSSDGSYSSSSDNSKSSSHKLQTIATEKQRSLQPPRRRPKQTQASRICSASNKTKTNKKHPTQQKHLVYSQNRSKQEEKIPIVVMVHVILIQSIQSARIMAAQTHDQQ